MERRGAVNLYTPYQTDNVGHDIINSLRRGKKPTVEPTRHFTLNLANGVTPFMMTFGGVECNSHNYLYPQGVGSVHIQIAFYRPTKAVFDTFDDQVKEHVLQGGLVPVALHIAATAQLPDDPIEIDTDFETMLRHFQAIYGVSFKTLAPPVS